MLCSTGLARNARGLFGETRVPYSHASGVQRGRCPGYHPPMRAKLMSLFLLGLIRFLTGAQARWYGCPPKAEQRIYFANHQSHADLVMIWAALPHELRGITRPIAAKDYWIKTPCSTHWRMATR